MLGQHVLNSSSITQPNPPALSTGEAEFNAEIRACIEAIYLKNLLNSFGHETKASVETDSSAAKGIIGRLGASKETKHFAVKKFWVQSLVREKVIQVRKIAGYDHYTLLYSADGLDWRTAVNKSEGLCSDRSTIIQNRELTALS